MDVTELRARYAAGERDFRRADLSYADLRNADLRNADLRNADLSYANLRNTLIDETTKLNKKWRLVWEIINQGGVGRKLRRADLSSADLEGANLESANLEYANLEGANLKGANLNNAYLEANLKNVNLSGAKLSKAYLICAYLRGIQLNGANLSGTRLNKAILIEANLEGANLSRANLKEANLTEANLQRADITGANLGGANITGANLQEANLRQANLEGANLSRANLIEADLEGANIEGADTEGAYFSRAEFFRNCRWTVENTRKFVGSLIDHLETFTSAELYLMFQQSGLLYTQGKSKGFLKALATGRFPRKELEKFTNGKRSTVDKFIQNQNLTLETLENRGDDTPDTESPTSGYNLNDQIDKTLDPPEVEENSSLRVVQTRDVLKSLDHHVIPSADEEAVQFLIASAKAKIWKHVFRDEAAAVAQAETYTGDNYAERVKAEFLDEYHQAKNLNIPTGYAFRINGELTPPNLMQRLVVVRVRDKKRVGNWSGTGAGKTLSAVLASRVINAHLSVICCPNSVVAGWEKAILDIFPESAIATKTFTPDWAKAIGDETGLGAALKPDTHRYLILNYEMFQQPDSKNWVRTLVNNDKIDFVVVDEIHYTKQRQVDNPSERKQRITQLITTAGERNSNLHVIGMSATPVINNLQEGKSLVELVTGVAHDELDIKPTIPNCMRLHQRLVTLGIRWMPEYQMSYEEIPIEVDCGEFINEIRALGQNGTPLALEQILTRARLPIIRRHIQPKTLIYTHYVQEIDRLLKEALEADGWKVGFYTGEVESDSRRNILEEFKKGDVDVLIGSSAIGTGVDGLQEVCNRLIINVLPWTHAEFEQLKGRIYRQGQRRDKVTAIIPLTYADVNGDRWSWCDSKMQRLRFKKSIADAAVDGIVPEGHLRTPAQAYQDVIAWLERLEAGKVEVITRPKIVIPLPDDDPTDVQRRMRRYGDFSNMNRHWNQSRSETTHQRLQANPEEWAQYHTFYRESRKDWAVIPYEDMIRWCQQRSGYSIGDFGCGEAKLAEAVSDRHTVYSFDHIAVNNNVIACDMAHVPLDDETLDVAIFSLSLMGSNFTDYLHEAHRTLKLDGQLHIIEATSRFSNLGQFQTDLEALGFTVLKVQDMWKFTHIRAMKTERNPQDGVVLHF